MERKSAYIKGKRGHHEIKNPYLIEREKGNDRALNEKGRNTDRLKNQPIRRAPIGRATARLSK
ncbi:MAG: hypothetical protein AAB588_06375 [Patescibacteria group bacterium]